MRKTAEKVAIVAQICITLVFVVTTLLYISNLIPQNNNLLADNGILATLVIILAAVYAGLSVYIIYVNFSQRENLRQILLFCDSESATHANTKVIRHVVRSCARQVKGIRIRKTKLRLDEKRGLVLTVKIDVSGERLSQSVDKLRCLVADSFKNTLGITFNTINFEIRKLKASYKPNVKRAEELAKTLTEQRELSADIYESPFKDNCESCKDDNNAGVDDDIKRDVAELRKQLSDVGAEAHNDNGTSNGNNNDDSDEPEQNNGDALPDTADENDDNNAGAPATRQNDDSGNAPHNRL